MDKFLANDGPAKVIRKNHVMHPKSVEVDVSLLTTNDKYEIKRAKEEFEKEETITFGSLKF